MNLQKRKARAKARAKTGNLTRMGVPRTVSKWAYMSEWRAPERMPSIRVWQSVNRSPRARWQWENA